MARGKSSYESKVKELEELIDKMENNELSLEESISNYEKGMKLSNELYKILHSFEGKIKVLSEEGLKDFKHEEFEE